MILKRIHLVNFKKYEKSSISLGKSLIGIFGNNGAGKSTLFEAVTWCLYGAAQSMEGKEGVHQKDLIRDGEHEMGVEVEFTLGNHEYKVARYLNDKRGTRARLLIDGKLQARKSRDVTKRVSQDLGLHAKGFISSSFIRQKELDLITSQIASQRKKLINRLFNLRVYEKYEQAAKEKKKEKENELQGIITQIKEKEKDLELLPELESQLHELKKRKSHLQGEYDSITTRSETIKQKYAQLEEKYETYQKLVSQCTVLKNDIENTQKILKEKEEELKTIDKAAKKKESLQSEYDKYIKLKEKFTALDKIKSQYDAKVNQMQNLQTEIDITGKAIEQRITELTTEINEYRTKKEQLKESEEKLEKVKKEISALEDVPQKIEEKNEKLHKMKDKKSGFLAEKAKHDSHIQELNKELTDIQSIGIGAPCPKCKRPLKKEHITQLVTQLSNEITVHEKAKEKYESKEKHLIEMEQELTTKIKNLKEKEKKLHELKKEEKKYMKAHIQIEDITKRIKENTSKIEENTKKYNELEKRKEDIKQLQTEIEKLKFNPKEYEKIKKDVEEKSLIEKDMITLTERISKKGHVMNQIEKTHKTLETLKEDAEKNFKLLHEYNNIPEKFEQIKKEKEDITKKELQISKEYTEIKILYQEREKEFKKLQKSKDVLTQMKKKKDISEDMIQVYAVLQDAFKQIPVQVQSRLRPRIRKETSTLLEEVTEGKYPYIDLEKDYSLTVYYDGEYYPISRFSGGEKDLINLCLRVGISRVLVSLSSQKNFARVQSLFLDECFGSFDRE
ncbi:MAG: SMC family ATPase, partial [Candidatus Methanofastidiosia archaeon]